MAQQKRIRLASMRMNVRFLALLSGLRIWHWPAAVTATRPLAWEPPYAVGVALGRKKKKKNLHNFLEIPPSCCSSRVIAFYYQVLFHDVMHQFVTVSQRGQLLCLR